jgi:hypothetical protein
VPIYENEMATIRTSCPGCGEVDLNPDAVMVSVHQESGEGLYRFVCPKCMEPVEKRADRRIVALLKSVGVGVVENGEVPETVSVPHPESPPEGPLFTTDDVINFHFMLEDDDALAQFVSSGSV